MEKINERKSGALLSYLSIIISTLVQLLYTPLLIRMLGQSEYGLGCKKNMMKKKNYMVCFLLFFA